MAEEPEFWRDKPIEISSDGSFREAGDTFYGTISGKAPVDIGEGKVGQRIVDGGFCTFVERLLVVDCFSLETIVIYGRRDPDDPGIGGGMPTYELAMLYPPHGKIRLTKSVTIAELAAISKAEGYHYDADPRKTFASVKKKNRYNPFTGCKVLYPDSPGATQ
jgi:hypothetical protein